MDRIHIIACRPEVYPPGHSSPILYKQFDAKCVFSRYSIYVINISEKTWLVLLIIISYNFILSGGIFNLEFSPDGRILSAACERKNILIFDPLTRKWSKSYNIYTLILLFVYICGEKQNYGSIFQLLFLRLKEGVNIC